jgi:hypothetical protein
VTPDLLEQMGAMVLLALLVLLGLLETPVLVFLLLVLPVRFSGKPAILTTIPSGGLSLPGLLRGVLSPERCLHRRTLTLR